MKKLEEVLDTFRNDEGWNTLNPNGTHRFDEKIAWIEQMVKSYAEALHMTPDEVISIMEEKRDYSWPNYYQEGNFPGIQSEALYGVFEDFDQFRTYAMEHWAGYKCPKCGDISPSPQECIHRIKKERKCDWCAYGFFGAPRGVVIKSTGLHMIPIFEPVEKQEEKAI